MGPSAPVFGVGPSTIATLHDLRCSTTESGDCRVMKQRSSAPGASLGADTQSLAPVGRTLNFCRPNFSAVWRYSPNTSRCMPSTRSYHATVVSTSRQLSTTWSMRSMERTMAISSAHRVDEVAARAATAAARRRHHGRLVDEQDEVAERLVPVEGSLADDAGAVAVG